MLEFMISIGVSNNPPYPLTAIDIYGHLEPILEHEERWGIKSVDVKEVRDK